MTVDTVGITRRGLLAGLGLGGGLLLTGCTSAVNQGKSDGSASDGTPVAGGTLQLAIPDDLVPANLMTNALSSITVLIGLVYESLIRYRNDKVEAEPRLATSWELSADGLTLTLQLRKGVKFHSGREFTSPDVAFSIQTYADKKWSGQERSTAAAITSVDTSDPYVAVLHLEHPLSNIFDVLDTIIIIDKDTFSDLSTGKQYVGTGPFKFESWTPNASLVFTKNPNYWQAGLPYLDGVRASIIPDATSRLSQLKAGQVQLGYNLAFSDVKTLSTNSAFTVIRLDGAENQSYVGCNLDAKPLDDVRVRQAIAYAIDRDRIITEVFKGSGYATNLPWPKYSAAWDEEKNKRYALDAAKAKALISQVGAIPTIPYTYPTNVPAHASVAQIVQSNLADVGIKVALDPVDGATFTSRLIGAKFPGIWTTYHSWAQYTPSTLAVSAYPFNAAHNASHYSSATYSKNADVAWKTPDGKSPEAVTNYAALSDDLLNALFLIEIGVVQLNWATTSKLKGVSYTKRGELDVTHAYLA